MHIKNIKEFEKLILGDVDFFDKFIKEREENIIAAPEDFASSVMLKINALNSVKSIPFIGRKTRAALCFCSAAAIMAMTFFGINGRISDLLTEAVSPGNIGRIGEFFDSLARLNFN
ncbi:MAG: hypothetical protein FWH10_05335 [Oscillospiraceae bacterium]|nr:hypothetical protein [Oscillospiraceae bacterium]